MAKSPKTPPKASAAKPSAKAAAAKTTRARAKSSAPKASATPADPYAPITEAERGLLEAVDEDGIFDARALPEAERVVRSAFLRALLLHRIEGKTVPETGLTTLGLIFEEELNLSFASLAGSALPPLDLIEATFNRGASFDDAQIAGLFLYGSTVTGGIRFQRARITGSAKFDRLTCGGGLNLLGADIGGQLSLSGTQLTGAKNAEGQIVGDALSADGAVIKDDVFCHPVDGHRFEAYGKVRFLGADIGGQLSLKGARLTGVKDAEGQVVGDSLSADGAVIKGGVFCNPADGHRFEADGEVRLVGADIGGALNLNGARLIGVKDAEGHVVGNALSADRAVIKGSVFCDLADGHCFEAYGEVRLLGAEIAGSLYLKGARLTGAKNAKGQIVGDALSADRAVIKGSVFCASADGHCFEAYGKVRFLGADIGGQLNLMRARLTGAKNAEGQVVGHALSAEGVSIKGVTFLGPAVAATGGIGFRGARLSDLAISGEFKCDTAANDALDFSDATLRRLIVRTVDRFGKFNLEGATAETFDGFGPANWGKPPTEKEGLELDLDGFTYRRAEFGPGEARPRHRKWAKFADRDTHSFAENVLELLDREFRPGSPERQHYFPQPFEQAAKALREAGYDREANAVAVAKREFKRQCKAEGKLATFTSSLSCLFFRHGYGPGRAILWMANFVALGAVAAASASAYGLLVATPVPGQPLHSCLEDPIAYALDAFLPLVDLGVDKQCRVDLAKANGWWVEGLRVTYAILGWLFVPMVALTFAGVLRKD